MNQSLSLITDKNKEQITSTLLSFEKYLLTVKTGLITPRLLDNTYVKHNGKKTRIDHIATIEVKKNSIININPWDKTYIKIIEKAILEGPSKFFPHNNGKQIFIKIPPPTKEDRIDTSKMLKKQGEQSKISIRQTRRNNNNSIKLYIKKNKLPSSIEKKYLNIIQKQTDDAIKFIDDSIEKKKRSIMAL